MTISEIYILLNDNKFAEVTAEVKKLNKSYRDGNPLITDLEYDRLLETIKFVNPENEIFTSGVIETLDEVDSDRKETLKFPMYSLNKESSLEEIHKWLLNKGLPLSTMLVCTAKYDGISILKDEWTLETWSRGDGIEGETVTEHYKKLNDKSNKIKLFTIGEMIIPKPVFASHTFHRDNGEPFKNARNMIAGLKNSDTISNDLQYAKHVRYGFADEDFMMNKSEQLDFITTHLALVPYRVFRADALKIEELNDLFVEWGKEYDIDGLVLDIDDKNIRKQLGRERNNNPAYSRAFKNPEWSENADTEIVDIEWNISKQGYLKPVGILTPIELEGVTVSRVTLNNAKFAKDNGLGVGSQVVIKRSGMVIPKIVKVLKSTGFKMPEIKDSVVFWNDNGVELCVSNTNEQEIKKIISFFEILKTDNVSEGIVKQLYNAGYTTIKQILNLSISDFEKLDKFGKRKAEIVYNAIKKATTDVDLAKLMHSSNLFVNLGSKKLELLVHFTSKPSYKDILAIKGFSDISAKNFLDGYDKFYDFIKDLPITIKSKKQEQQPKNNNSNMKKGSLEGMSVLFTGVRRQDLVDEIEARGGKNLSAISKNVTHLICKDKNSSSSKMVKAKELGIQIMSVEELEMFLNK
jgi:NAD-dependent DNA ligase